MMNNYKQYEADCDEIKKENEALLNIFEKHLQQENLSPKTIKSHIDNIDFYINGYLLYSDAIPAHKGFSEISGFLGDWFIRKAMWSSCAHIKQNAASLKKFYSFLLEFGAIKKEDLEELKETIKDEMEDWLESMKGYGSDESDDYF